MAPHTASQKDLLLITGATGHIGFATLLFALQHTTYPVRLAVRNVANAKSSVLSANAITSLDLPSTRLDFVSVPDITVPGAYDSALKDVTHVIHIASPIPSAHLSASAEELEGIFIAPAVNGTMSLLESCKANSTVRRVVLLSSVIATMPAPFWACLKPVPEGTVFTAASRTQPPPTPYQSLPQAYAASKVRALNDAEAWVKEQRPQFDVLSVHPGWVIGRDELKTTKEGVRSGTNNMLLQLVVDGGKAGMPKAGCAVHVRDVGRICVGALDEQVAKVEKGTVRGFMAGRPVVWNEAIAVVEREFGKEVEGGLLSVKGDQPTNNMPVDGSESEKVFEFTWESWEEMIKGVVSHYVEVSRA